ncbi:MAG: putative sensor domain DACNV-containing protein, partial [Pyrinomonadaceae bacterium]
MTGPAYPAARAVADTAQAHFARRLAEARRKGHAEGLATEPAAREIEAIIDAAFWASLRREEGYSPKISLAFLPPGQAGRPLLFERRLPLNPAALSRLAPAVERPGIHLGVWRDAEELYVWGTTRTIPRLCFVLEVVEPGLLVIKYRRGQEPGKYVNVAVLKGDQIKVVDEESAGLPDCPTLLTSLLDFGAPGHAPDSVNVLVQLAASMRAHGRGGSLLVVPHGSE